MAEAPVTKADVRAELRMWVKLFNLEEYHFTLKFDGVRSDNYATADVESDYLRAEICVNLSTLQDRRVLRRKLIHELLHVQLAEYTHPAEVFAGKRKKILRTAEERLVTRMERWEIWKAWD